MDGLRVAALYVLGRSSPYRNIPGVDLWPKIRDARTYPGALPVVAHPDCGPWSRSWAHACKKGPEVAAMAPLAVEQVRTWGGVLEHPARSMLWDVAGDGPRRERLPLPVPWELRRPPEEAQLRLDLAPPVPPCDAFGGFTIEVLLCWWGTPEQPVYVEKPTWLYFVGVDFDEVMDALPEPCEPAEPPRHPGYRSDFPSQRRSAADIMSPEARQRTPEPMARWLVDLVEKAKPPEDR